MNSPTKGKYSTMFQHTSSNKLILSLSREPLIIFKQRLLRQDNEMSADALIIQQKAERVLVRGINGSASELVREVSSQGFPGGFSGY